MTGRLLAAVVSALALGLVGCVGARLQVSGGYVVARCNFAGVPESACFEDIARECPDGFEVVDRDQVGAIGTVTITARCAATSSVSGLLEETAR